MEIEKLSEQFQETFEKSVVQESESMVSAFVAHIPNILLALLVIVVFRFLAKGAERLSVKYIDSKMDNPSNLRSFTPAVVKTLVMLLGLVAVLGVMNLKGAVSSALAGAGVVGLVLGFALQEISSNVVAGIVLAFRQPFRVGEHIRTSDGIEGIVQRIDLRTTIIKEFSGDTVFVPNKSLIVDPLTNVSASGKRRASLSCGVGYGEDLQRAEDVVIDAIKALDFVLEEEGVTAHYEAFDSSSINFVLRFWVDYPDSNNMGYLGAKSVAIKTIQSRFNEEGISIPFPIRTLVWDETQAKPLLGGAKRALQTDGDAAA